MRAGLLSNPKVIKCINDHFVSTWILQLNLVRLAERDDPLAKRLLPSWEYPLDMMFLSPEGQVLSKLNSYKDFKDVHADVSAPPSKFKEGTNAPSKVEIFLDHVAAHFGAR